MKYSKQYQAAAVPTSCDFPWREPQVSTRCPSVYVLMCQKWTVKTVHHVASHICVQGLINQGRQKVIEATNALKMVPRESLEDIISKVVRLSHSRQRTNMKSFRKGTLLLLCRERQRVISVAGFLSSQWQENPGLLESQVQSVAMAQQATLEMEFKRREAVYRDVLNRQQSVRTRNLETRTSLWPN